MSYSDRGGISTCLSQGFFGRFTARVWRYLVFLSHCSCPSAASAPGAGLAAEVRRCCSPVPPAGWRAPGGLPARPRLSTRPARCIRGWAGARPARGVTRPARRRPVAESARRARPRRRGRAPVVAQRGEVVRGSATVRSSAPPTWLSARAAAAEGRERSAARAARDRQRRSRVLDARRPRGGAPTARARAQRRGGGGAPGGAAAVAPPLKPPPSESAAPRRAGAPPRARAPAGERRGPRRAPGRRRRAGRGPSLTRAAEADRDTAAADRGTVAPRGGVVVRRRRCRVVGVAAGAGLAPDTTCRAGAARRRGAGARAPRRLRRRLSLGGPPRPPAGAAAGASPRRRTPPRAPRARAPRPRPRPPRRRGGGIFACRGTCRRRISWRCAWPSSAGAARGRLGVWRRFLDR